MHQKSVHYIEFPLDRESLYREKIVFEENPEHWMVEVEWSGVERGIKFCY